jgi:hypothetical protein
MSNNISSENRATIGLTREQIQEKGMGSLKEHSMKDIIPEAFFNFFEGLDLGVWKSRLI